MFKSRLLAITALMFTTAACASAPTNGSTETRVERPIALAQVEAAQTAWCAALVEIGRLGATGGDAKGYADKVLSSAYDYDNGKVLFKPTLTYGAQTFRLTKDGALAYFVGGNQAYPNDSGFALKQWVTCTPKIAGVVAQGDMAIATGNVYMTDAKGNQVMVDKTFGYLRGADGQLRIVLHHSSLPFAPAK